MNFMYWNIINFSYSNVLNCLINNWFVEFSIYWNNSSDWLWWLWFSWNIDFKDWKIYFWNNFFRNIMNIFNIESVYFLICISLNHLFCLSSFFVYFLNWNIVNFLYCYYFMSFISDWFIIFIIYFNDSLFGYFLSNWNWFICKDWCKYFWDGS